MLSRLGKLLKPKNLWLLTGAKKGFCPVCRRSTLFVFPDPPATVRNHAMCVFCRSASRNRHLAKCILDEFRGKGIVRLSDFSRRPELRVFHTASGGIISDALGKGKNIVRAEFFEGVSPGDYQGGVLCQDLENLTFPSDFFDLIISEDVFEHLKDYSRGFAEVHRVLKPGGCHIFSIPFYFDRKTESLFRRIESSYEPIGPIEYHGDPIRGQIPAYSRFGYDLLEFLRSNGYSVKVEISQFEENIRYGTYNSYTFMTWKL